MERSKLILGGKIRVGSVHRLIELALMDILLAVGIAGTDPARELSLFVCRNLMVKAAENDAIYNVVGSFHGRLVGKTTEKVIHVD